MAEAQSTRTCSIDGCEKAERVRSKRLCAMHYSRLRRHGSTGPAEPQRGGTCTVDGCESGREARGLCSAHYQRIRNGRPLHPPIRQAKQASECSVEPCDKKPIAGGLCGMHYQRQRSGAEMDAPARIYSRWETNSCAVEGCEKLRRDMQYCSGHAARHRRGADMHAPWRGEADPSDPGTWSRVKSSSGYIVLETSVGGVPRRIAEHRWIMQVHIGRELVADENVHHVNGDRTDNRIENLELWSTSQPSGQRVEDKLAWAREIIARYDRLGVAGGVEDGVS